MSENSNIQSIKVGKIEWVHISKSGKKEINHLRRRFGLHPVDLHETLPPLQRPKLVVRDGYLFMILLYPVFDRQTRAIYASEVDFFIHPDRLITVNRGGLEPLHQIFKAHGKDRDVSAGRTAVNHQMPDTIEDVTHLLYLILDAQLEAIFPMITHLSNDIDDIERHVFSEFEKNLIQELLRVKTNIVNVRKAIQGHKTVIRRLIDESGTRFPIHKLEIYFERLVEHTKELWDTLENQRDTINALHEANMSLIDFRINEIMKKLTVFSVIVFPLTLLAAIFGMNAPKMPFVTHPLGFWMIIGIMAVGSMGMLAIFKFKKWI